VNRRERRIAHIVRDFLESYERSQRIGERLRSGELEFAEVERLVGEDEQSTLFRLKEECHSLFRSDAEAARGELAGEELLDLAIGALFHEAMKFREGYYVVTTYGPRLERLLASGTPPSALTTTFQRVLEAGRRRMLEAQAETQELFRETRDQLCVLLRQLPESGAVARSLVEDPALCERVFGVPIDALLADLYGSATIGRGLAVASLVEGGHYAEAAELLERCEAATTAHRGASAFARGMARYYAGDLAGSVELLAAWIGAGCAGDARWREHACRALRAVAGDADALESSLPGRAHDLLKSLTA
jgi:hypothetical protein